MYEQGDLGMGIISCGQGVSMANDTPIVKKLFDSIISQAKDIAGRLAAE